MKQQQKKSLKAQLLSYKRHPGSFVVFLLLCLATLLTAGTFILLLAHIIINGIPNLSLDLFSFEYTSDNASMMPAIINTLSVTLLSLLVAVPVGIFSAIYLTEYARRGNKFVSVVRVTAETLSGIPSIVYGLFGYLMFNIWMGVGYSLISGVLTMAIMILPLIMRTTEEAILAVPDLYREGSFGLGAGRLRTVFSVVLPAAVPGILAGVILGIGRIVGETAALMFTAGTATEIATGLGDSGRTLSVHMYMLLNEGLHMNEAHATAVVLLVLVVGINALSAFVAKRIGKRGMA